MQLFQLRKYFYSQDQIEKFLVENQMTLGKDPFYYDDFKIKFTNEDKKFEHQKQAGSWSVIEHEDTWAVKL